MRCDEVSATFKQLNYRPRLNRCKPEFVEHFRALEYSLNLSQDGVRNEKGETV
jgi:hypothetical protein